MADYAELQCLTNFSFLEGASHAEELVIQAKALGLAALGVADRNTLAGVVRAHKAAKEHGVRLLVGARLDFTDASGETADGSVIVYPCNRAAYGRLSRLITTGRRRVEKGNCLLTLDDLLAEAGQDFILIALPDEQMPVARLHALGKAFPGSVFLAASNLLRGDDRGEIARLARQAQEAGIRLLATNDILMHSRARRPLADVLLCIRTGDTIDTAGLALQRNAERHLKSPDQMAALFDGQAEALAVTMEIMQRCTFSLDELAYEYPDEVLLPGMTAQQSLEKLAWEGAATRYPGGVPAKVRKQVEHELSLIGELNYAAYFLTVYDMVRFARSQKILCQGRGSAANSAVCYCLGITAVDPSKLDLLFERFISSERDEPPDIDVDFEHERREEVIQYIYEKYGRHRAGLAATVIRYRARGAVREVGKAMGLSSDTLSLLAGQIWGWSGEAVADEDLIHLGLNPKDRRLRQTIILINQAIGFPRHLSQHVGGFVIARGRLDELCPVENAAMEDRTVVQWDKDDLDALGMLKVDVLALGMLSCLRKGFDLLRSHYGRDLDLASLPATDKATYDMLCKADSLGVFQVESRAQMAFLPRMKPRDFYDLVIEVAIVRPGPIQGDMVHPYLRRRNGEERVEYPSEELREVLGKTLGVPLFQEQAMKIAIVAAGFTPPEADRLRRAMATFRHTGTIHTFHEKMVEGMVARGYDPEFAERCFKQIEGFGEYGFPESHAASFALLVYVSAWMKCHYPAAFACALLNSQPMGFYAPAQIVRDAADHGIEVRPVDVNASDWDNTLEASDCPGGFAVRLGLRQVKGLARDDADWVVAARGNGYSQPMDLWRRASIGKRGLAVLAKADAFGSMDLSRRQALWSVQAVGGDQPLPLFEAMGEEDQGAEPFIPLPETTMGEEVVQDYAALRLSLKDHPVRLLRDHFPKDTKAGMLKELKPGSTVSVCGLVLVRQRPGSARGVVFVTLEDETGWANIIVWADAFQRYRRMILPSRMMRVTGTLQREGIVTHIVAKTIEDASDKLDTLADGERFREAIANADEVKKPIPENRLPKRRPVSRAHVLDRPETVIAPEGHRGAGYHPIKPPVRHPREQAKRIFSD